MENVSIKQLKLVFDGWGDLCSFLVQDKEIAAPGGLSLFRIQFRDFIGNPILLDSRSFEKIKREKNGNGWSLQFEECRKLPGTVVRISVEVSGWESYWRIAADSGKKEYEAEWFDFPRIRLQHEIGGQWLLPVMEGILLQNLEERERSEFKCEAASYPLSGVSSFYPGPAAMQFEAYISDELSIFFGCPDPKHNPKTIDFLPDGPDAFFPMIQHFTGGENEVAYHTVVRLFQGDWQEAAELYRQWMETHDPLLPPKLADNPIPWLKDSPVILIYPVRGSGLDSQMLEPNEYFPYSNALPMIREYQHCFQSRIMALLMHWEGTAPWAPPYIWPPLGGEIMMKTFVDEMHRTGNLVGLYASGIGWTQQSMIEPSYNRQEEFVRNNVSKEICRGPHGEAYSRVCNGPKGQRIGYDLCPAREFTRQLVSHEIASAARLNLDYLQYFDQNQGCAAPLCYSEAHGHSRLPGHWQTEAMRTLLDHAKGAAGNMVLGCENAAAEPYMTVCRLNDMRSHIAWGIGGMQVPLYQYLFHEYSAGFTGNGVCLSFWIDFNKTPFFLQWFLGWNFAAGNMLAVVLKNSGKIHWCWVIPWNVPEPSQQPLRTLICNLNFWRKGAAGKYLIHGRMEKKKQIFCRTRTIFRLNGQPVEVPAIESSAWSSNRETRALILVNYGEQPEQCRIIFERTAQRKIIFSDREEKNNSSEITLLIPPLNMVLIEEEYDKCL